MLYRNFPETAQHVGLEFTYEYGYGDSIDTFLELHYQRPYTEADLDDEKNNLTRMKNARRRQYEQLKKEFNNGDS